MNYVEEAPEVKKNRSTNGLVKVLVIIHKRANQSDTILAYIMFHKVINMNGYINS